MDISRMKWECDGIGLVPLNSAMTVRVNFTENGISDQTEFCIMTCDRIELDELFSAFCIENQFKHVNVTSVQVIRVAENMDRLIEIEEIESSKNCAVAVEISYSSDGTKEEPILCSSLEQAWETCRAAAIREAEEDSELYGSAEVGLSFNRRSLEIKLRYHDNTYCIYRIVRM